MLRDCLIFHRSQTQVESEGTPGFEPGTCGFAVSRSIITTEPCAQVVTGVSRIKKLQTVLPKAKSPKQKHTRNWAVLMKLLSQQFEAGFIQEASNAHPPTGPN